MDRFVAQTHQHTHAADPEGNNLLKARAGIKRSARDTAEKTQNINCYELIHVIFVIRRVFVCMELSSKLELIYILYN